MEHARRTRLTKIGRARYLEVVAHVVAEVSRDNGRRGLWGQRRNGPVLAGVLAAKAVGARGNGGVMVAKGSFLELFFRSNFLPHAPRRKSLPGEAIDMRPEKRPTISYKSTRTERTDTARDVSPGSNKGSERQSDRQ